MKDRPRLISLARTLGQQPDILEGVARGELHSAMLAFGLWAQEDDLADLAFDIRRNRDNQLSREPESHIED